MKPRRIIVGISGGSGPMLGVRLLEVLRGEENVETHLIITPAAVRTLQLEAPTLDLEKVRNLADHVYDHRDIAAAVSSGSYPVEAMVVIPASMNTAAAIAHGLADNLLVRAADVTLKERRNLIVVPRESPLHLGHLRTLTTLAELGACILPPMLAFYGRPTSVEDLIDHVVGRVLDQLRVEHVIAPRWEGPPKP